MNCVINPSWRPNFVHLELSFSKCSEVSFDVDNNVETGDCSVLVRVSSKYIKTSPFERLHNSASMCQADELDIKMFCRIPINNGRRMDYT